MLQPIITHSQRETIQALAEQVRRVETARRADRESTFTSGSAALDRLLPGGGFHRATLVEWLAEGRGSGTLTLACMAAREASRDAGALVVIDASRRFYPPAAAALGIDVARLIVVRPQCAADHVWACDQVLRCQGVAAALCWPGRWDDRTLRRLQLAVESSGAVGLLMRPATAAGEPCWAEVRLLVCPRPGSTAAHGRRLLRVQLLHGHGSGPGSVELELDGQTGTAYETNALRLVPSVAASASRRRATGA